jgi:hypothetical protein
MPSQRIGPAAIAGVSEQAFDDGRLSLPPVPAVSMRKESDNGQ